MEYIPPPSNLIEFLVDASGSIAGTMLSIRGLVVLFLSLLVGVFRRSIWWVIPITAAMPIVLLFVLLPVWSSNGVPSGAQFSYATYICLSYVVSGLSGYAIGRILRSWKYGYS